MARSRRCPVRRHREVCRRPSRHTVKVPCQVVRESDFRLVADRVENLSAFGMLVRPADPVLTGEKVLVSFQLPGSLKWVDVPATVVRVVHGRRPYEVSRMLGLQFDGMSPYERFQIRKALEGKPPAPPGARPGRRDASRITEALARSCV